jgi:hypothetical protein
MSYNELGKYRGKSGKTRENQGINQGKIGKIREKIRENQGI